MTAQRGTTDKLLRSEKPRKTLRIDGLDMTGFKHWEGKEERGREGRRGCF